MTKAMRESHTATLRSKRTARSFLRDLWTTRNTTTAMFTSSAAEPVTYRAKNAFLATSYTDMQKGRRTWSTMHTLSARHLGQNPSLMKSSALPYCISSCHSQSCGELSQGSLEHEELMSSVIRLHREHSWQYCDRCTPSTVVRLLSCSNCSLWSQCSFPVTSSFFSYCSSLVGFTSQTRRSLKDKFLECMANLNNCSGSHSLCSRGKYSQRLGFLLVAKINNCTVRKEQIY